MIDLDLINATIDTLKEGCHGRNYRCRDCTFYFLAACEECNYCGDHHSCFRFVCIHSHGLVWDYFKHYVVGGVALAVGDLVDAGIVMVENAMKTISGEAETN